MMDLPNVDSQKRLKSSMFVVIGEVFCAVDVKGF